jgi:hypothetical protein
VAKERQIVAALPEAWERLVADEDELLLEIVADRVENLCGFKPDPDTVAKWLKQRLGRAAPRNEAGKTAAPPAPPEKPARAPVTAPSTSAPIDRAPREAAAHSLPIGFDLDGRHHSSRNACDVMVQVFEALTLKDASFPERFAGLPKHGRTRRYLASTADELYPGRPDLCREHSIKLKSGWWVSTNHSRATIRRIIEMACDVVGLRLGSDLTVNLGE